MFSKFHLSAWFVMFDIMLGRHICLTQCKAVILSFTSNFSSFRANTSLRSRRLEVMGARKNGAREGDTRGEIEVAPAREAHESRFHSLSESAEGSYCSYLREQYLAFYNTQHAFFKKYPFLTPSVFFVFIVPLVKNDLMLCIYHRFITPSLYNQIT